VIGLVKPQFEAGREHVQRGGRVTDAAVHADVLARVREAGAGLGLRAVAQLASPIAGKKSGNREFLVLWRDAREPAAEAGGSAGPGTPGEPPPHTPAGRA
jgi:predicted rRNA methylase YqxC with S4 and FtsJ domains